MDSKTISRTENAVTAIDVDGIARLARGLGVPPAWLFSDDWTTADAPTQESATPDSSATDETALQRHPTWPDRQ